MSAPYGVATAASRPSRTRATHLHRERPVTSPHIPYAAGIPARVVGEGVLFEIYFTDGEITDYRSTLSADRARLTRFVALLRERGIFRGA